MLRGGDDAGGENVAAEDAAENIDEPGFDRGIAHKDAESVLGLFGGGAPANSEKIRGGAASVLDDIHCGHGKTRTVDHAGDAAIELDVVEAVFGSFDFERIFFIEVAEFAKLLVTEKRIVVKSHLGVEGDEFAFTGEHARIDFEQRGVSIDESAVKSLKERGRRIDGFDRQAETEGELASLIRLQTQGRMNRFAQNGARIFPGDFLDFHAARGAGHEDNAPGGAIDKEPEIKFALDVEAFFDEQALDDAAAGTALRSDQLHTENMAART